MHHNTERRKLTLDIGSLQQALDKPILSDKRSLSARENFHIMDIGEEPPVPDDLMLETVRTGPWRQTVESHLTWKNQLLEDITTKQLRTNRWKDVKRVEQEFKEANARRTTRRKTAPRGCLKRFTRTQSPHNYKYQKRGNELRRFARAVWYY
jgi:hypothetical protein